MTRLIEPCAPASGWEHRSSLAPEAWDRCQRKMYKETMGFFQGIFTIGLGILKNPQSWVVYVLNTLL
jgi:hypothetical protein